MLETWQEVVLPLLAQDLRKHGYRDNADALQELKSSYLLLLTETALTGASQEFLAQSKQENAQRNYPSHARKFGLNRRLMNGATQNGLDLGNPLHLQLEKDLARLTTAEPKTVGPSILKRLGEIEARFSQAGFELQSRLRGQFQNGFAWALLKLARSAAKVTDKQLQQLLATCERLLDTGSGRDNALEAIGVALSKKRKLTKKHRELLARLVKRQEPEIIEHFGYHIWGFLRTWPDFVLDCLDRWTRRIGEEAVANALPHTFHNSWFRWLFNADKERALKLLERMLERARRSNRTELARGFLTWFALVAIQENEPRSRELVEAALSKLELPGNETEGVVQVLVGRQMPRDPKNAPPIDVFERVSAF